METCITAVSKPDNAGDTISLRSPSKTQVSDHALEFHNWRNQFNIQNIKNKARQTQSNITIAILATGGCIDAIAAIKAGFKPLWATEICPLRQSMWQDLTGTTCYGDTFKQDYTQIMKPDYLTSGQPCIDYSRSGSQTGDKGETGWMFTEQTRVIMQIQPLAIRLEISDQAIKVHQGKEVMQVMNILKQCYVITAEIIPVWHYGDCTSRRRLFIMGLHKSLGPEAHAFKFPLQTHTSSLV